MPILERYPEISKKKLTITRRVSDVITEVGLEKNVYVSHCQEGIFFKLIGFHFVLYFNRANTDPKESHAKNRARVGTP